MPREYCTLSQTDDPPLANCLWRLVPLALDAGDDGERGFVVGTEDEDPAEAAAVDKQVGRMMPGICVNFVSVATGKSLLAPLVTHLYTTCNPRFCHKNRM
mgnify:CR=1 FL=1